ncbi:MAG: hypothetical protein ACK5S6_01755 [bacterium]|jgi:hypothetical protein
MKIEKITEKTGKITALTLEAIKSTPRKTADKSKSLKDAFVSGYREGAENVEIIDEI